MRSTGGCFSGFTSSENVYNGSRHITMGHAISQWGRPYHNGARHITMGHAISQWGRPYHNGADHITMGHAISQWGTPYLNGARHITMGTPYPNGARHITMGHAISQWGQTISQWGTPYHNGAHHIPMGHAISQWGRPYLVNGIKWGKHVTKKLKNDIMVEAAENLLSILTFSGQNQKTEDLDDMKSTFSEKIQQWMGVSLPAIIYVSVLKLVQFDITMSGDVIGPPQGRMSEDLGTKLSSSKALQCPCNMARREQMLAGGEHCSSRQKLEEGTMKARHQQVAVITSGSLKSRSDDDYFQSVGTPSPGNHLRVMTDEKTPAAQHGRRLGGQDQAERRSARESPTLAQDPSPDLDIGRPVNRSPILSGCSLQPVELCSGQRLSTLLTAEEATAALLQGNFRGGAGLATSGKKTYLEIENLEEFLVSNSTGGLRQRGADTACRNRKNKKRRLRSSGQVTGPTKPTACPSSEPEDRSVIPHAVHSHLNLTGDTLLSPEVLPMSDRTPVHHPVSIAVRKRRGPSSRKRSAKCLLERWGDRSATLCRPADVGETHREALAREYRANCASHVVHNFCKNQAVDGPERGPCTYLETRHRPAEQKADHSMNHLPKDGGISYSVISGWDLQNLRGDFITPDSRNYPSLSVAKERYTPVKDSLGHDKMYLSKNSTRGDIKRNASMQYKGEDLVRDSRRESAGTHFRPIFHQAHQRVYVNKKVHANRWSPVRRPVISGGHSPFSTKRGCKGHASKKKVSPLHLHRPPRLWKENPTVAKNVSSNMNPANTESSKPSPNHAGYFSSGQGNLIRQSRCACPIKHQRPRPFCRGSSPEGDESTVPRVLSRALNGIRETPPSEVYTPSTTRWNVSPLNNTSLDWSCSTGDSYVSSSGRRLLNAGIGSAARDGPFRAVADSRRSEQQRAEKVYYFHYDSDNESCDVDLGVSAEGCIRDVDDDDDDDVLSIKVNPGDSDGHLTFHPSFTNERHDGVGLGSRPLVRFSDRQKSSDSLQDTFHDNKPGLPTDAPNNKFNYSFSLHECSDSVFSDDVRQIHVPRSESQCGVRKSKIPVPSRLANFSNSRIECDRKLPPRYQSRMNRLADKSRVLQTSSHGLQREPNELPNRATPISSELNICRIYSTHVMDAHGFVKNALGRMPEKQLNAYQHTRVESNNVCNLSHGRFEGRNVRGEFCVTPDVTDLEDERKPQNLYNRGGVRKSVKSDSENKRTNMGDVLEKNRQCVAKKTPTETPGVSRHRNPIFTAPAQVDRKVFPNQKQPRSSSTQSFTRRGRGENMQSCNGGRKVVDRVNSKHQIRTAIDRQKIHSPVDSNRLAHRDDTGDTGGDDYWRACERLDMRRKNEDDHDSPRLGNAGRIISHGPTQSMSNIPLPQYSPYPCYGRQLTTSGKRTPQKMLSQLATSPYPKPRNSFSKLLPSGSIRAKKTSSANVLSTTNLTSRSSLHSDLCAEDYFPITCVTYRDYYSMSDRTSRTTSPNTSCQRRSSQSKKVWPVIPPSDTSTADVVSPPPNKHHPKRPSTYNSGEDLGNKYVAVARRAQPQEEARCYRKNLNQLTNSTRRSPSLQYGQEANGAHCKATKSSNDTGKVFMVQSPPRVPEASRSAFSSDISDKGKPFIQPADAPVIMESLKETLLYRRGNSKRLNREDATREASFGQFATSEAESDVHNEETVNSIKQVRMIASQAHEAFKRVPIPCFEISGSKISPSDIRLTSTPPRASVDSASKRPQEGKSSADSDGPTKKTKAQNNKGGDRNRKKSNTPTPPRKFLQEKSESKPPGRNRVPSAGRSNVRAPWDPHVRGDGLNKTEGPKRRPDTTFLDGRSRTPKEEPREKTMPICGEAGHSQGKNLVLTESSTARHLLGNVDELREKYLKEMLSKDIYQQLPVDISPAGYRKAIIDHYQFEMMSMKGQFVPRVEDSTNVIMTPAQTKTNQAPCARAPGRCPESIVLVNSSLTTGSKGNNKVEKRALMRNVSIRPSSDKLSRLKDKIVSTMSVQTANNDSLKSALEDENCRLVSFGDTTWPAVSASAGKKEEEKCRTRCGPREQSGVTELHNEGGAHGYTLVNDVSSLSRDDEPLFAGETTCSPSAVRPSEIGGKPGSEENLDSFIGAICDQAKYYVSAQTDAVSGEYENSIEEDNQQRSHNMEILTIHEKFACNANTEKSQCNGVTTKTRRLETGGLEEISDKVYDGETLPSNRGDDTQGVHTKATPDSERLSKLLSAHNKPFDQLTMKTKTQEPDNFNLARVDSKRSTFSEHILRAHCAQPALGPVNNARRRFETTKSLDLKKNSQKNEHATKENGDGQYIGPCLEKSKNVSPLRKQEVTSGTLKPESKRQPSRESLHSDLDSHRRNLRKSGFRGSGNKGYVTSAMQYCKKKSENQSMVVGQCQKQAESITPLEKNNSANFRRRMLRNTPDETRRCGDCFRYMMVHDYSSNDVKYAAAMRKIIQASQSQLDNQTQLPSSTGEHCGVKSSLWPQRNNSPLTYKDQTSSCICDNVSPDHIDTSTAVGALRHPQPMNVMDTRDRASGQPATNEASSEQRGHLKSNGEATSRSHLSGSARVSFDWYKPSATNHLRRVPAAERAGRNAVSTDPPSGFSVNPRTRPFLQVINSHLGASVAAMGAPYYDLRDDGERMDSGFRETTHNTSAHCPPVSNERGGQLFHDQLQNTRREYNSSDDEDGSRSVCNAHTSLRHGPRGSGGTPRGNRESCGATHRQTRGQDNVSDALSIYNNLLQSYNQVNQAMHDDWLLQNTTHKPDLKGRPVAST
ncbi:hypothetical protein Btru_067117 [Bulinus truncatus]|nr:hypothetical protein Btru_067117 [Bulinus truncatus]